MGVERGGHGRWLGSGSRRAYGMGGPDYETVEGIRNVLDLVYCLAVMSLKADLAAV